MRTYRYYDVIMAAFVTVLLCSNFIGAAKQAVVDLPLLGPTPFGAGVLFFPISYIFGDILTEVYGYGRDRRVVWAGFGALAFASFMAWVVVSLPPAPSAYMKTYQPALEAVFGNAWRIALGSMIAFWCGSFSNSYVLAKMKIWTGGKWLWTRTIGSTIVGELVDSLLFYMIAFYAIWETSDIVKVAHGAVPAEDRLGSGDDAGHLPRGRVPQARGERGLLRPGHGLHAVPGEGLGLRLLR